MVYFEVHFTYVLPIECILIKKKSGMKVSQTLVTIKSANFKSLENFYVYNVATSCMYVSV